jgi:hypothetical protein
MTSREHARRLMLILLASPGGPTPTGRPPGKQKDERTGERQAPEGRDDSTDGDEQRTTQRAEAFVLS